MHEIEQFARQVTANVERVIIGKSDVIEALLVALLCEGHVLLEDVPGTGKTMLARALALSLGVDFRRVQCTPDLLPNDITGVSVYNQREQAFQFIKGPAFTNILLADEVNRATPRTQSSLLECMGERQISVDGRTYTLDRPFLVIATQNPIEFEGTFPLPEAQLDRFMMRLKLGYLDHSTESQLLLNLGRTHPIETVEQVVDGHRLPDLSRLVWEINVDTTVRDYVVSLVQATRNNPHIVNGASPRASLALYRAGQALAAIRGREYVLPDDVKELVPYILPHRCMIHPESALKGVSVETVIGQLLRDTPLELGEPG